MNIDKTKNFEEMKAFFRKREILLGIEFLQSMSTILIKREREKESLASFIKQKSENREKTLFQCVYINISSKSDVV